MTSKDFDIMGEFLTADSIKHSKYFFLTSLQQQQRQHREHFNDDDAEDLSFFEQKYALVHPITKIWGHIFGEVDLPPVQFDKVFFNHCYRQSWNLRGIGQLVHQLRPPHGRVHVTGFQVFWDNFGNDMLHTLNLFFDRKVVDQYHSVFSFNTQTLENLLQNQMTYYSLPRFQLIDAPPCAATDGGLIDDGSLVANKKQKIEQIETTAQNCEQHFRREKY